MEENDGDPLLNDMLCTNQLAVKMKLFRMALAGIDTRVNRGHVQLEEGAESLGVQFHDTKLWLGTNPGTFASPDDWAWDGIAIIQGNWEGLKASIRSQVMSDTREEMQGVLQNIKSEALDATCADFYQLVAPLKFKPILMRNKLRLLKQDN
jgi:hypothetical protein